MMAAREERRSFLDKEFFEKVAEALRVVAQMGKDIAVVQSDVIRFRGYFDGSESIPVKLALLQQQYLILREDFDDVDGESVPIAIRVMQEKLDGMLVQFQGLQTLLAEIQKAIREKKEIAQAIEIQQEEIRGRVEVKKKWIVGILGLLGTGAAFLGEWLKRKFFP